MDAPISVERIKHWGLKGGMAIVDQGIFSGSNFILNILLARWLSPPDYGAFAIGYSVLLFFLQILMSYVLEPMGVLGPSSYNEQLRSYLAGQVRLYFVVIGPMSLLFAGVIYVYGRYAGNPMVSNILATIGLTLSLLLLPWMLRRVFYLLGRPDISAAGSLIYGILLVLCIAVAQRLHILTGLTSILVIAVAGLLSGLFLAAKLNWDALFHSLIRVRTLFLENWRFGKWLLASGLLITAGGQAQIFLSGSLLSLQDAGVVNAMQAFAHPMIVSITAVSALVTPSLAADYARADLTSFQHKSFSMTIILTGLAAAFELILFVFKVPLEFVVYGGKFSAYAYLIPIWGLIPLIMAMVSGMQYSLQAAKRPYAILIASLFWVPSTLGLGIVMILRWGLWGLALSTIIGYVVLASVLAYLYWKWIVVRR